MKALTCATCCEEMTLPTSKFYGNGVADRCPYTLRKCKFCCQCGGH